MIVDQKTFQCRKVRKLGKARSSTRALCNEAPHWGCAHSADGTRDAYAGGELHLFFTQYGLCMHVRRLHGIKRPSKPSHVLPMRRRT